MYDDGPAVQQANDALWAFVAGRLAAEGVEAPPALTRGADLEGLWRAPGLLLAQTCGYPLMTRLRGAVQLVATPRYAAPGCKGATHRSAIVVRASSGAASLADLRGGRCAVNDAESNTGMNLMRAAAAPLATAGAFFGEVQFTGSHRESVSAVARGEADVAAIDAVTLAHLQRLSPDLAKGVRVLQWTQASPGLPLITSGSTPPVVIAALRRALDEAVLAPSLDGARRELLLDGFERLSEADYDRVLRIRQAAVARGYPVLN